MRAHAPRRTGWLPVAIAVWLALLTFGAQAAGTARWVEVPSFHISGDQNEINALVSANSSVWAFGEDLSSIPEWRVLGEQWNGHSWIVLNMPDRETAPAQDFLRGAAATGAADVWVVGSSATAIGNLQSRDLIEHWDGQSWTIVDPSLQQNLSRNLSGVTARPGDVWAVGDVTYPNGPDYVPWVIHRAGGRWSTVGFHLAVPGCKNFARGVLSSAVFAGRTLYVAGWCQFENLNGRNGPQRGFVAQWTGKTWSLALEAPLGQEINALASAPDGTVWVAGDTGAPGVGNIKGRLWRGSGTTWAPVPVPGSALIGRLNAVTASSTAIYTAGSYQNTSTGANYVIAVNPRTAKAELETIAPFRSGSVFVGGLTAPNGAAPWLGGSALEGTQSGRGAILAKRQLSR